MTSTEQQRKWADVSDEELRHYQRSPEYDDVMDDWLERADKRVADARAALTEAERQRRVAAAIHVRAGAAKTAVANALGVSRPTLDAWLKVVGADADEMESVLHHERLIKREIARGRVALDG